MRIKEISLLQISFILLRYWGLKERGVDKLFDLPSPNSLPLERAIIVNTSVVETGTYVVNLR